MHKQAILQYITTEIAPDVNPDEIAPTYDLYDGGILNSLAMVRLVAWLGEKYQIPVNEIEIVPDDLRTVEGIDAFIVAQAVGGVHPAERPVP